MGERYFASHTHDEGGDDSRTDDNRNNVMPKFRVKLMNLICAVAVKFNALHVTMLIYFDGIYFLIVNY